MTLRVVVADDQRSVRDGLAMLVGLCEGIEVVGTAPNGAAAVALVDQLAPDVVLMDLRMPEMDGVQATRQITGRSAARVVVLTTYADDESVFPALRAGAAGYLTKDASAEEIEAAIRAVHRGQTWLDPVVQAGWSARSATAFRMRLHARSPGSAVTSPRGRSRCSRSSVRGCRTGRSANGSCSARRRSRRT